MYTPLKSEFNGLQFRRWHYRPIFIRLAVVTSHHEITRNSDKIWPYSSSRSSKVIDLGVNQKPMYDLLLVTNSNLAVSATVFEIFTLKARKSLNFHTPPLFEASVRGQPLRIWLWNLAPEYYNHGATRRCTFHNPIFNRFCMIHPCDGQTDGQTDRQTDGR